MSPRRESLPWLLEHGWWVMPACVIAAGLVGNWSIVAGLLAVLLIHAFQPFEFIAACLLVTAGSTFVYSRSDVGLAISAARMLGRSASSTSPTARS